MFNQYQYKFKLKLDVQYPRKYTNFGSVNHYNKIEYSSHSMSEILEEVRRDFNLPEDFDFKSEFEYKGILFKLKFYYWGTNEEILDPFDELSKDES